MNQTEVPNKPRVVFDLGRTVDEAAAIRLRDRALMLLRGHGEWRADGEGHKLLCRETEQLVIAYEDAKARRRGQALVCRHQEG